MIDSNIHMVQITDDIMTVTWKKSPFHPCPPGSALLVSYSSFQKLKKKKIKKKTAYTSQHTHTNSYIIFIMFNIDALKTHFKICNRTVRKIKEPPRLEMRRNLWVRESWLFGPGPSVGPWCFRDEGKNEGTLFCPPYGNTESLKGKVEKCWPTVGRWGCCLLGFTPE